ncbi:hypothetical protein JOC34_000856 [Virgibacillus halotolerans]|nr:hypothetical protein [Virgibacillus halotolerans]MBM7598499.1 hypothetical protein [Virgibacillus halotolerans]
MIRAINNYFFDEDSITLSDALFFFGIIGIMLFIGISTWFI